MPTSPPQHRPAYAPSVRQEKLNGNRAYNAVDRIGQEFYSSLAWRRLRTWFVRENPLCVQCINEGIATTAQVVDHITPIRQGGELLDADNLQSLCHRHHNRKSATERQ